MIDALAGVAIRVGHVVADLVADLAAQVADRIEVTILATSTRGLAVVLHALDEIARIALLELVVGLASVVALEHDVEVAAFALGSGLGLDPLLEIHARVLGLELLLELLHLGRRLVAEDLVELAGLLADVTDGRVACLEQLRDLGDLAVRDTFLRGLELRRRQLLLEERHVALVTGGLRSLVGLREQ